MRPSTLSPPTPIIRRPKPRPRVWERTQEFESERQKFYELTDALAAAAQTHDVTAADVMAATEGVMACFEIVDSRIDNWQIKIQDTVADNASCGVFVLGDKLVDPRHVDLALAGMVLEKNGDIIGTGAGAASMGHPANAVAWLANTLGEFGIPLKAG